MGSIKGVMVPPSPSASAPSLRCGKNFPNILPSNSAAIPTPLYGASQSSAKAASDQL